MATVFVLAGSPEAEPPQGCRPGPGDRVIAADRGAAHARAWGWPVHLLVGDLDSLAPHAAAREAADGTPVVRAPTEKDDTDLELALEHALRLEPDAILICAALGGRTDHLLANVLLLTRPDLAGRDIRIVNGRETVRVAAAGGRCEISGARGDLLTLLPIHGPAEQVRTEGLLYPLRGETLHQGEARGVSNVFADRQAAVTLERGLLLVLHLGQE